MQPRNDYCNAPDKIAVNLNDFFKFCKVDLHLSKSTIDRNRCLMGHIVRGCGSDPSAGIFWAQSKAPFTAIITLMP